MNNELFFQVLVLVQQDAQRLINMDKCERDSGYVSPLRDRVVANLYFNLGKAFGLCPTDWTDERDAILAAHHAVLAGDLDRAIDNLKPITEAALEPNPEVY